MDTLQKETVNIGEITHSLETIATVPMWRAQSIRALQILGSASAVVGGLNVTPFLAFLDPQTAAIVAGVGIFARMEAPKIINFTGDLFDNGKIDGSFPVVRLLLLLLCAFPLLALGACGTGRIFRLEPPTADGCLMGTYGDGLKSYSVGPCAGPDGKIDRYRAVWTNADGVKLRSTYLVALKRTQVEYSHDAGATWLPWGGKAGVSLDGAPAGAQLSAVPKS